MRGRGASVIRGYHTREAAAGSVVGGADVRSVAAARPAGRKETANGHTRWQCYGRTAGGRGQCNAQCELSNRAAATQQTITQGILY